MGCGSRANANTDSFGPSARVGAVVRFYFYWLKWQERRTPRSRGASSMGRVTRPFPHQARKTTFPDRRAAATTDSRRTVGSSVPPIRVRAGPVGPAAPDRDVGPEVTVRGAAYSESTPNARSNSLDARALLWVRLASAMNSGMPSKRSRPASVR